MQVGNSLSNHSISSLPVSQPEENSGSFPGEGGSFATEINLSRRNRKRSKKNLNHLSFEDVNEEAASSSSLSTKSVKRSRSSLPEMNLQSLEQIQNELHSLSIDDISDFDAPTNNSDQEDSPPSEVTVKELLREEESLDSLIKEACALSCALTKSKELAGETNGELELEGAANLSKSSDDSAYSDQIPSELFVMSSFTDKITNSLNATTASFEEDFNNKTCDVSSNKDISEDSFKNQLEFSTVLTLSYVRARDLTLNIEKARAYLETLQDSDTTHELEDLKQRMKSVFETKAKSSFEHAKWSKRFTQEFKQRQKHFMDLNGQAKSAELLHLQLRAELSELEKRPLPVKPKKNLLSKLFSYRTKKK